MELGFDLSKMFKKKGTGSVLGIDIGSSAIKIVQIRKKGAQAVLETYGELALGPYGGGVIGQSVVLPPEKIAEALSDLMKEKEVNITTRSCGLSIPFSSSLMSVIELPAVGKKELDAMVPLEARKYIPMPITEVQLDWFEIPKTTNDGRPAANDSQSPSPTPPGGSTGQAAEPATIRLGGEAPPPTLPTKEILLVAIHNDTLSRFKTIVEKAALDAKFFEIELFSTMRAVVDEPLKPVMIVDIGAASTKIYIVERGIVRSTHTVNRGAQDTTKMISQSLGQTLQNAEVLKRESGLLGDKQLADVIKLSLDYIFDEANHTLLSYEKKYNKAVGKVFLVGGGATLKGLAPVAEESFKTQAILGDPFSRLVAPAFLEAVLKDAGPEFAVAIGLALRRLAEEE